MKTTALIIRILMILLILPGIILLTNQDQVWAENTLHQKDKVRASVGAGEYYPADTSELYNMVGRLITADPKVGCKGVRAVLVPHAGYVYSGSVAAAGFREIDPNFHRVFILASNHNSSVDFSGVSIPRFSHYSIPGVNIPLDDIIDGLRKDPLFDHKPEVHNGYMIEVELPFLHYLHGKSKPTEFTIVPMILGRMDSEAIQRLSQILNHYADSQTVFVFSVDLSHFYNNNRARELDMSTIQSVMSMDIEALNHTETDGNQVLLTMVELAEQNDWEPTFLKYRNSGEITGDLDQVVGYASIAFHESFSLSIEEQKDLVSLTRSTINDLLQGKPVKDPDRTYLDQHPIFRIPRGVFVTLEENGRLRGCIGELFPRGPLYKSIQSCAIKAATRDPRFDPVTSEELKKLSISISILGFPCRVKTSDPATFPKILRPGKDGVILVHRGRQSTYLPKVWKDIPLPAEFLSRLCLKQGSPVNCWMDRDTALYRYGSYDFGEERSLDSFPE